MNGLEKIYPSKPTYEEFAIKKTDVDRYRFVDKVRTTYRFVRDVGNGIMILIQTAVLMNMNGTGKMNWKDLIITRKLSFWKMAGS